MRDTLTEPDFQSFAADKLPLMRHFFSRDCGGSRFLIGRNDDSAALAAKIPIAGFIDDFLASSDWRGTPVVKMESLPNSAVVMNCSTSISPVAVDRRLQDFAGRITGHFSLGDAFHSFPELVAPPDFVLATREDYCRSKEAWQALYAALADEESRRTLQEVLAYRVSANPAVMARYGIRVADQYFEDFVGIGPAETFVDGGGYDGDTTAQLYQRTGGLKASYLFEPDRGNMEKARLRLRDIPGVVYLPFGLSDQRGQLRFAADGGSASRISAEGGSTIEVTSLDLAVPEPISFIKLDVEGAELAALRGAERHIREDRPKLAVAVYHNPADLHAVPDLIGGWRQDYRLYLRHYTQGWSETVMYFVPIG